MPTSVLIVDDDGAFRRAAGELLSARGYSVAGEASSAAEALAAAAALHPDAVLLDVGLPDADGTDLVGDLRARAGCVVLLTSSDPAAVPDALAQECGAAGFVAKPDLAGSPLDRYLSP